MRKLLLAALLFVVSCGDTPPPLDMNVRATDCDSLGAEVVRDLSDIGWCTVRGFVPVRAGLDGSELDAPMSIPRPPDEPESLGVFLADPYSDEWNLKAIRGFEAQEITQGEGVKVMVIDTGIVEHQDLPPALDCLDTITGTDGCADGHGHGSHVAGIIAMIKDNEYGAVGVSPNVSVGACKALNDSGSGTVSSVAECIVEAVRLDYDVINMSLGSPSPSNLISDALDHAAANGIVLVAACGNNGRGSLGGVCETPAIHQNVISVGAVDPTMFVPEWSNGGPDLVAPGVDVLSTVRRNGYFRWSGTSMASPHVAGAAALYLAQGGTGEAMLAITGTTKPIDCPSGRCGAGLLDMLALLTQAPVPTPTPQPSPVPTEEATVTPSPFPSATDTPLTCSVVVPQVSTWTDIDRWWHYSGAAYLNWLAADQQHWSFQPLDIGGDYMHLSIVSKNPAICEAFKVLFIEAGYNVRESNGSSSN